MSRMAQAVVQLGSSNLGKNKTTVVTFMSLNGQGKEVERSVALIKHMLNSIIPFTA